MAEGVTFLQVIKIDGARAAAFHLLKVVAAFHIPHKEQAFQWLHVRAGGDHIHRNGDARMVVVAELRQDAFGIFA